MKVWEIAEVVDDSEGVGLRVEGEHLLDVSNVHTRRRRFVASFINFACRRACEKAVREFAAKHGIEIKEENNV